MRPDNTNQLGDSKSTAGFHVRKCTHGHLHLNFRQLTISLTVSEFEELAKVITRAYIRHGIEDALAEVSKYQPQHSTH